jgi:hypothetical protein
MSPPVRLQAAPAAKEKRLAALLGESGLRPDDPGLAAVVEDAQILGSLELAGFRFAWDEVRASRGSGEGPAELLALRRARSAVASGAPFTVSALRAWHEALAGPVGFRRVEREREGAPPAPPGFVLSRLETLEDWLATAGSRDLSPEQAAAVALARIVEILPFEDANGRISRLAASHLMVRGGMRPPILVAGDGPRRRRDDPDARAQLTVGRHVSCYNPVREARHG